MEWGLTPQRKDKAHGHYMGTPTGQCTEEPPKRGARLEVSGTSEINATPFRLPTFNQCSPGSWETDPEGSRQLQINSEIYALINLAGDGNGVGKSRHTSSPTPGTIL